MDKDVPDVEGGDGNSDELSTRLQQVEVRLLDAEAAAKESLNREADQRYTLRWIAVAVCLVLIIAMMIILFHMSHHVFWGPFLVVPSSYAIALVVAPIASITAIMLALFIAAFRGYKKGDEERAANVATEGARSVGIIR